MKVHTDDLYCPICFFRFTTYGFPCSLLMDLVLGHYMEQKPLTFNDSELHDRLFKIPLEFLEKKGFLISTEFNAERIQVIPNLSKCIIDEHRSRFCWC